MSSSDRTTQQPHPLEQASDWWVRQNAGPLSDVEQAEFADWLQADPSHQAAWQSLTDLWDDMDGLSTRYSQSPYAKNAVSKLRYQPRHWLSIGAVGLALVGIVIHSVPWVRWQADYYAPAGTTKHVELSDGSKIDLDGNSAIAVDIRPGLRHVALLQGEAWFEVTPDPARPFRVHAGTASITALGTVFDVSQNGDKVHIAAVDHRIAVAIDSESAEPIVLSPGQAAVATHDKGLRTNSRTDLNGVGAWRRGQLVFEDRPLEEVVDALNRSHHGLIVLAGNDLRTRRVNGVFRKDQPLNALKTIERALNLRSTRLTDYLIVLHH